ncbi:hypothetical protein [Vibrio crassostreae]|uniref:hypothetical protein n=1 Tax=Vibrio crassostreae TaxID=246167 RepID=UPI001B303FAB|nr:hypothetical protein [Vibrio crassostreae]
MKWRLQSHSRVEQLVEELTIAFPDILLELNPNDYLSIATSPYTPAIEARVPAKLLTLHEDRQIDDSY